MSARTLVITTVAVTAGLVAFIFVQFQGSGRDGGVSVGINKASAACLEDSPNCLPLLTLIDTTGKAWTPDELAGRVVVINYWATWCKPCKAEIPDFVRVYNRFKSKGIIFLGIMTDQVSDQALEMFSKQTGLNYPTVRSDDEINFAFAYPNALPTTFIYDQTGYLRFEKRGPMSDSQLESELLDLLSQ